MTIPTCPDSPQPLTPNESAPHNGCQTAGSQALSASAQHLVTILLDYLRSEYADRCRGRHPIEKSLDRLNERCHSLEPEESRRIMRLVRPLYGYSRMSVSERQHRLTECGLQLGKLVPSNKPTSPSAVAKTESPTELPYSKSTAKILRLDSDLSYLRVVTSNAAKLLNNAGIIQIKDLLLNYPRRWEDRSHIQPISQVSDQAMETVCGQLGESAVKKIRPGLTVSEVTLTDTTGSITLTWFNQPYITKRLNLRQQLYAFGKVERDLYGTKMASPEIEYVNEPALSTRRIVPTYRLPGNMSQAYMRKIMAEVVGIYASRITDPLPQPIQQKYQFVSYGQAISQYHWPASYANKEQAQIRLAYQELLVLQLQIAQRRQELQAEHRHQKYGNAAELTESFLQLVPFAPTKAQARLFQEILVDLAKPFPMNRLLQGDVGSGKTLVAAFAAYIAVKNGYQVAIMAPTEILAEQHFSKLSTLLSPANIRVGRLQGSMSKKAKMATYRQLAEHELDLVVGTHALIQDGVEFANLALAVVDEQHKFGVMQRTILRQKGGNPDVLVMTATPIPRTMALTLYGHLDISRLDELPPGRQPVRSYSVRSSQKEQVYELVRQQLRQGRQAYVVCPLINESDKVEATAAIQEAEHLKTEVFPEFRVGLMHGKMKASEKESVMEDFRQGRSDLLISTTVIEVGVDIPNAAVMLIQDADRFGLAQLHQLRGRVGRGKYESACYFIGQANSSQAHHKLEAIARLANGFDVAEEDLELRGPGDYCGIRQSGMPELRVADLVRDQVLLRNAKDDAQEMIAQDPNLDNPEHQLLQQLLQRYLAKSAEMIH